MLQGIRIDCVASNKRLRPPPLSITPIFFPFMFARGLASPLPVGDNHRTPYDATSGRIFDGFLTVSPPFVANQTLPAASLGFLSAPTIFVSGEAERAFRFIPGQIAEISGNPNLNVQAVARFYTIRNVPALNTDFTLSMYFPMPNAGADDVGVAVSRGTRRSGASTVS